ncbi:peptidase, partial [Thioclava sp. BHET1]
MQSPIPVFDGHNDFLLRLLMAPDRREEIWLTGEGRGHLDLHRMQKGGFAGGFFAIYIPSPQDGDDDVAVDSRMSNPPYVLDLPPLIPHTHA